jgi:feruloyl esterase
MEGVSVLQALPIKNAATKHVAYETSPTLTLPDGKVLEKLPVRTTVKLLLKPAERSNVRVEIWLPEPAKWNGRFLGLGNGGAAGGINVGSLAGACNAGYAVAHTDMGTAPNDRSGVGNPEVWKDFGHRATHLMTVAAKQCVTAFYGRPPEFSYFNGGSTGGQQGMASAQRYPEDYDGIVSHISAHCRTPLHAYFLWNDQILTRRPFTEQQWAGVITAANQTLAHREIPQIAGKFVSDPRATPAEIEAVIALAMKNDATLTPDHAKAMRQLFAGPTHAVTGERIFDGVPLGATVHDARGHLYLFAWAFEGKKKPADINFAGDIDAYTAALGPHLNAENPNLDAFRARGGKLLLTVGTADAVVPYHVSIDYYERVVQRVGKIDDVLPFFHLYVIPGLSHGGRSPGLNSLPDLLKTVRDWREKNVAPASLACRRVVDGKVELAMPVYPYPLQTGWDEPTKSFKPMPGRRGGVGRIADRFLPPAADEGG